MKKPFARRRLRELEERGLEESDEATQLKFSVEVTKHDKRDLVL